MKRIAGAGCGEILHHKRPIHTGVEVEVDFLSPSTFCRRAVDKKVM